MLRTSLVIALALIPAAGARADTPLTWESITPIIMLPSGHAAYVLQGPSRPLTDVDVAALSAWNSSLDVTVFGAPERLLSYPDDWAPASPAPLESMKIRPPE